MFGMNLIMDALQKEAQEQILCPSIRGSRSYFLSTEPNCWAPHELDHGSQFISAEQIQSLTHMCNRQKTSKRHKGQSLYNIVRISRRQYCLF